MYTHTGKMHTQTHTRPHSFWLGEEQIEGERKLVIQWPTRTVPHKQQAHTTEIAHALHNKPY